MMSKCLGECGHCGKKNAPMACPNCSTAYCNARCQGDNWQYHKTYACAEDVVNSKQKGAEYLTPSTNSAKNDPPLVVPFPKGCQCGDGNCQHKGPYSINRLLGGRMSFLGMLSMPDGRYLKLDNPRDFGFAPNDPRVRMGGPGHYMTVPEFTTEFRHCDDYGGGFTDLPDMRDINSLLVDLSGRKKGSDSPTMYPFHAKLKAPYKNSKPPKFRADDIVTVVTSKELKLTDNLIIAPKTILQVYVISFMAHGLVTGVIESNLSHHWVYFGHHCVRQLVKRGCHWK